MKKYNKYLKSNEWKKLRKKAYIRAKGICEFCGKKAQAIHHISYSKNSNKNDIDLLIAVCKKCHRLSHGLRYKKQDKKIKYNNKEFCDNCHIKFNIEDLDMENGRMLCRSCEENIK